METVGKSHFGVGAADARAARRRERGAENMAARATSGAKSARRGRNDYCVYILECSDGSFYTGITTDLARRVAAHNAGRGARYTRSRRPVRVIYAEPAGDRAAAARRERAIKRLPRAAKEALVRRGLDKERIFVASGQEQSR